MKVKIKYQYPTTSTCEGEAVIDIPDDENPQNWIDEHEQELLIEQGAEEYSLDADIDMGYAKVTLISGVIR